MRHNDYRNHAISGVFVFVLLGLFATLATLLTLFGVQAYRNTLNRTAVHNTDRIMQAYIRNAVAAADQEGCIALEDIDGITVLILTDLEDGEAYCKHIYLHDHCLKELYIPAEDDFDPEDGEVICEADGFTAELNDSLLTLHLTNTDQSEYTVSIALYTGA